MRIADFTAKSIHFNGEILPLLKLNGQKLSPSRQLQVTNQLFGYLQQLYGIVPKATQILSLIHILMYSQIIQLV